MTILPARRPSWKVILGSAVGALLAVTAVVGFAHTPAGRPMLVWMGKAMGRGGAVCPLGYGRAATPADREQARARFAAAHSGSEASASRPALGFELDRTTRADVSSWASAHHLSCKPGMGVADVSCSEVPDALLPAPFRGAGTQTLWFVFGAGQRLVSVIAIANARRPEVISAAFGSVVADLSAEAGSPATLQGDASAAALSAGALYQATAEYRFRDYYAVVRATHLGQGYAMTEEYRSLPN